MKIFLVSTSLDDIRWATESGLADGVLTTPALLAQSGPDAEGRDLIAEICRVTTCPVAVSVAHVDPDAIYRDGRELARLSDQVVVQIPFVEDALGAMHRLSVDGVRVAATLVFGAAQALIASKVGASAVVASLPQLDAQGDDPAEVIHAMRRVLDAHDGECDVMAALPRTSGQFAAVAAAGADAVAVDPATLRALLLHPLTDRGMDQLLGELSRRPKPRAVP